MVMPMEETIVTLRDFFVEKLTALEKSTESARAALEKNVETARSALEKNTETARSALEKNTELARSSLEKNTEVSRLALEKRLDSMTEFREALKDQANSFITRIEMNLIMGKLEADIRVLRESKASGDGAASLKTAAIATGIAVVGAIASVFLIAKH